RVFGRNADAVSQALQQAFPDALVEINPEKPRRNSFEVALLKEDGSRVELWTGLKKGPPRKLKFPEPNNVVELLKGNLD
uniref:Selenoprotein H n=2 Tax=Varanus komodoensis TaxID=61221 RepID=A0A8D2LI32_VARKO